MKKRLLMLILTLGASLLTLIATSASAGACWWYAFQPEEPEALK